MDDSQVVHTIFFRPGATDPATSTACASWTCDPDDLPLWPSSREYFIMIVWRSGKQCNKILRRMKRLRLTISFNSLLAYRYNHFVTVIVTFLSAICDGKTNPYGACTLRYTNDRILKRDGSVHTVSGGTCSSPDRCTGCNDGFYSTGPYCESKTQNWITLQMLCFTLTWVFC